VVEVMPERHWSSLFKGRPWRFGGARYFARRSYPLPVHVVKPTMEVRHSARSSMRAAGCELELTHVGTAGCVRRHVFMAHQ
jgi:hypothetical protein